MRCFRTCTERVDVKKNLNAQFGYNLSKLRPFENTDNWLLCLIWAKYAICVRSTRAKLYLLKIIEWDSHNIYSRFRHAMLRGLIDLSRKIDRAVGHVWWSRMACWPRRQSQVVYIPDCRRSWSSDCRCRNSGIGESCRSCEYVAICCSRLDGAITMS